jgi:hypothetical protein
MGFLDNVKVDWNSTWPKARVILKISGPKLKLMDYLSVSF